MKDMTNKILKMLQLQEGKIFKIKSTGRYLVIVPEDAEIKRLASALGTFMKPAKLFILAVNDVSSIKIAELIEGEKNA